MKTIVFLLAGTLVGAGSIGVYMGLQAKEEILREQRQAREDSLAAVALATSEAVVDSLESAGDSASNPASDEVGPAGPPRPEVGAADSSEVVTTLPATDPPVLLAEAVHQLDGEEGGGEAFADTTDLESRTNARLSKIFSEMKPAEAAQVLGYLDDDEIERILLGIRERDAAAILANMDPERAAAVSRRVLGNGRRSR